MVLLELSKYKNFSKFSRGVRFRLNKLFHIFELFFILIKQKNVDLEVYN